MRSAVGLKRTLTFWPLLFYGLGVIVGAGIYVATGAVIQRAGEAAPISFLLAGMAAGLTGLCYAELAARFPEAAGAASYVKHGLSSDWLGLLVGAATTLAVAVAAASIAHGAVLYLSELATVPPVLFTAILVSGFTAVAAFGVQASVWLAAAVGAIEIGGLLAATIVGFVVAPDLKLGAMLPSSPLIWQGVVAGAFIAFFAFIGFETLANMAEEVKEPRRTLPRAILGAVTASTVLYVASAFALAAAIAVANGVLVEIMMLARLFYGMARNGQLPDVLASVHPRTRTPVFATVLAGGIVLSAALLFPFQDLLVTANVLTLGIFALVDLTLWRLHRVDPGGHNGFRAPGWVPPAAAFVAVGLIAAEFLA